MKKNILNIALSTLLAVCCTLLILAVQRRMPGAEKTEAEQTPAASAESGASMELQGYANVLDYGADPTGHEDSTQCIQDALRDSRLLYFPQGTYRIDQLTISGSVTLQGAGDNCTVLKTSNLTENVLTFKDDGWHVKDMKFDAEANRTDGAYIFSGSNYATIENVAMNRQYVGIDLDGSWSVNISNITAYDGTPHEVAEGGAIIRLGNHAYTGPVNIRGLTAKPSSALLQPTSGICMKYVDVVHISDALIIWHNKDVLISPSGKQFATLIEITNSCFDTAQNGIYIEPQDGGRVLRCGMSNTWFGAHSQDSVVLDASDGTITGMQFTNCMFLANGGNGVSIGGEGVDGIYFSNSFSGGNQGSGLVISDGAQNVLWSGGAIGSTHEMVHGNVGYGYWVEPGCTGRICLADLRGNAMGVCRDEANGVAVLENNTGTP